MSEDKKVALAACSGMSPYGLIARVTSADTVDQTEDTISICMGATAADREGFRKLIRKYPIIAINGCEGDCTTKILQQKGVKPVKTINVLDELNQTDLKPHDVCRLDEEGERCVEHMKTLVKKEIKKIKDR
ncbi:MAG: putative zinc-binding protein [Methanobacterium sp.]|nr:putative zinc-binding protein [Methanobacterium sp.]